jgi:adenylylsulfate kinase-like enzyme
MRFVKMSGVLVVLISGPIASGKSALSRAVAAELEDAVGAPSSVVDLDLVYEMLDVRHGPKGDEHHWANTRRIAGKLARVLLREGRSVVVEGGDFAAHSGLSEFERELPETAAVRLVLLEVDLATALERARHDDSRGVSKDRTFLSEHYAGFRTEWPRRDVLHLNTGALSLAEAARAVVESLDLAK